MSRKQPTVALELLGCIDGVGSLDSCKPKLGFKTALDNLLGLGVFVLIHTVLVSEDANLSELHPAKVAAWLKKWNLGFDTIWTGQGKPHAKWFVENLEDLKKLVKELQK